MKRKPNNYGMIRHLTGSRSRPFAVYTPAFTVGGRQRRETIGFFATYEEADQALAAWNRTRGINMNFSLQDLYDDWSRHAFADLSKSTASSYKAAWNKMAGIAKMKVRDIRTAHFQRVVDAYRREGKSYSSLHDIKVLAGLLEKQAMEYDIIDKNYAEYITLPKNDVKEKEAFTDLQVDQLRQAAQADFMAARLVVILIYTGWRIGELLALTPGDYDPAAHTFTGGSKTDSGKNRIVPVGPEIQPYVDELLARGGCRLVCREQPHGRGKGRWIELVPMTPAYFRENLFKPTLDALGIKQKDGSDFTPHATRHTFATLARKSGVDPLVTKKIMGHSPKNSVTETTYTHIDVDMLNAAISTIAAKKNQPKTT